METEELANQIDQYNAMNAQLKTLHAQIDQSPVEGRAGGKAVCVTVNSAGDLVSLTLNPVILQPHNGAEIERLVLRAIDRAKAAKEAFIAEGMAPVMRGFD